MSKNCSMPARRFSTMTTKVDPSFASQRPLVQQKKKQNGLKRVIICSKTIKRPGCRSKMTTEGPKSTQTDTKSTQTDTKSTQIGYYLMGILEELNSMISAGRPTASDGPKWEKFVSTVRESRLKEPLYSFIDEKGVEYICNMRLLRYANPRFFNDMMNAVDWGAAVNESRTYDEVRESLFDDCPADELGIILVNNKAPPNSGEWDKVYPTDISFIWDDSLHREKRYWFAANQQ